MRYKKSRSKYRWEKIPVFPYEDRKLYEKLMEAYGYASVKEVKDRKVRQWG